MSAPPGNIVEIQTLLKGNPSVRPRAGGTKTALSTPLKDEKLLDVSKFSGMIEYQPEEFTFTAFAGTRLSDINSILFQHGQYLPFDPPFVERGATLGGTVASGLSGSGRYRYGGVRDFLLGVRFIDGRGEIVRGGGKVVKNVAGYDFPKLMVGSLGGLGVLVELSFKVFPKPKAFATLRQACGSLGEALQMVKRAAASSLALEALDLEVTEFGFTLWARIGGLSSALPQRIERWKGILGDCQVLQGPGEEQIWRLVGEMAWIPAGYTLVKVPITPVGIASLEAGLSGKPVLRRYIAGGQLAWLALDDSPRSLERLLADQGLTGLVVLGLPGFPLLGKPHGYSFLRKVKDVLDPAHRFVEV